MDLSHLPIGERLDVLLKQLDENSGNESGNLDYIQFVDRLAHDKQAPGIAEDHQLSDSEDLLDAESDLDDIENELGGSNRENANENEHLSANAGSPAASNLNAASEPDREIIDTIYQDAAIEPIYEKRVKRRSAKQIQLEIENAAREDQMVERNLTAEIGKRTVKTHTTASFLADLDNDDVTHHKQNQETHVKSANPESDDDNLIILPGSAMPNPKHVGRLSRPARDMLRFSPAVPAGQRKLLMERQRLAQLQLQQAQERKSQQIAALKEQGIGLESINQEIAAKQRQNAGGAKVFLEKEREIAAELKKQEYSGDDSDSESDEERHNSQLAAVYRKKIVDDNDSESDEEYNAEKQSLSDTPVTEAQCITLATHTDTQCSNGELPAVGRTGTQILAPVPASELARMMGTSLEKFHNTANNSDCSDDSGDDNDQHDSVDSSQDLTITGNFKASDPIIQPNLADIQDCDDMSSSQRLAEVRQRYLHAQALQRRQQMKKQQKPECNIFVEDQAEESDDEENGGINRNNDDREDVENDEEYDDGELEEFIDRKKRSIDSTELKRRFLEEEKLNDEKLLTRFVDGVNGGFRRQKQANHQFVFDDDNYCDDPEDTYRLIRAQKREQLIKQNKQIGKLASNFKTAAFFASITEDMVSRPTPLVKSTESVQKSLEFLRQVAASDGRRMNTNFPVERTHTTTDLVDDLPPRITKKPVVVRRTSTIIDRSRKLAKHASTGQGFASKFGTSIGGDQQHTEVVHHIGRAKPPTKPKARFVAPLAANSSVKRRQLVTTSDTGIFKRTWA